MKKTEVIDNANICDGNVIVGLASLEKVFMKKNTIVVLEVMV